MKAYQLANDPDTYGEDAGQWLIVSNDGEHELSAPMPERDATRLITLLEDRKVSELTLILLRAHAPAIRRKLVELRKAESILPNKEMVRMRCVMCQGRGYTEPLKRCDFCHGFGSAMVAPPRGDYTVPVKLEEGALAAFAARPSGGYSMSDAGISPYTSQEGLMVHVVCVTSEGEVRKIPNTVHGRQQARYAMANALAELNGTPLTRRLENSTDTTAPFDEYEVSGCREDDGVVEQCPDKEAQFFSLFGHTKGIGVTCIGDYPTRGDAERFEKRIRGASAIGAEWLEQCRVFMDRKAGWPSAELKSEVHAFIQSHHKGPHGA